VSRASWTPFQKDLQRLLTARGVPTTAGRSISEEIVNACGEYIIRIRFERVTGPANKVLTFRTGLKRVPLLADELRAALSALPRNIRWEWTSADAADFEARLQRLSDAARAADDRWRPARGRRPDHHRHHLENRVALALQRNGVAATAAKSGVFALLLEQVHCAVGISERDVHKSVRRACRAVKRV
jgi:hypothetical protein